MVNRPFARHFTCTAMSRFRRSPAVVRSIGPLGRRRSCILQCYSNLHLTCNSRFHWLINMEKYQLLVASTFMTQSIVVTGVDDE